MLRGIAAAPVVADGPPQIKTLEAFTLFEFLWASQAVSAESGQHSLDLFKWKEVYD